MTDAYYEALGGSRYRPTVHVQGAWRDDEQHMAPVGGLLVHAIEQHDPRPDLQLGKVTFDILGLIPLRDGVVAVRTLRPGRTIELVEATLAIGDRTVVRASAWRLSRQDTSAAAGDDVEAMPRPHDTARHGGLATWGGGYIASLQARVAPGARPGRARTWLRTDLDLVAGEVASPAARFLGLVDTANGVAVRRPPTEWMFPNVDLTVHLVREPAGPWVGLDTTVSFGASGLGVTSSWLFDEAGLVGRVEQCLTLRPMPEGGL